MNIDAIKNFLKEYAPNINQRQFDLIYRKWFSDEVAPTKVLTELLYKSGVDPLEYMTVIPTYYARNSDKVDSIFIPSNIAEIADNAFEDSNLRQLNFSEPMQCKFIGQFAFARTRIKKISIPDSVRRVEDHAFDECYDLKEVSIPGKFGFYLNSRVFKNCLNLREIQFRGTSGEFSENIFDPAWDEGSLIEYIKCTDKIIKI